MEYEVGDDLVIGLVHSNTSNFMSCKSVHIVAVLPQPAGPVSKHTCPGAY